MNIGSVRKISIVGVGFMGGSLAQALKNKFPKISIWGYARNRRSYAKLNKLKALDRIEKDLGKCIEGAEIVVLALPVGNILEYFVKIAPFLKKEAIVFDLGSTKADIEKAARKFLPKTVSFVGCHPLCGSEKSGAEFSDPGLYKNALCIITSSSRSPAAFFVERLWRRLGSEVVFMDAASHDKILSFVSHLPHLISFSFMRSVPDSYVKFSGASFKDLTRIAASRAPVWADVFLSNKKNIIRDLDSFIKVLRKFSVLLKKNNKQEVVDLIKRINLKASRLP